MMSETV